MRYKPERALKQDQSIRHNCIVIVTIQAREGIETIR